MDNKNMSKEGQVRETRGRLIPVTRWGEFHLWPSVPGLRWLIFNEHSNGFEYCVVRIGRRVFIDENRFDEWSRSHRKGA